jgi:MerR family transcriptional regulator, light-induced transcriptional regulator
MNAFTIKYLENLSGIKAHTIRIWEQRYNFLKPKRTETNIRNYTAEELKTVLNIALLNKYGYKMAQIDKMSMREVREKIIMLTDAEAQQERLINDLLQYMIDLDMDKFEDVLDNYIKARGIDKAISYLIFPFLNKIGILWQADNINAAQEHVVTNIIRQKLIVGIETVVSGKAINKKAILFLPEGEYHELGLLYIYYLLKSHGIQVLYLGANVPIRDLEFIIHQEKPVFLYSHITSIPGKFNYDKYLQQLRQKLGPTHLIISGMLARNYRKSTPANILLKKSLPEVQNYISSL